MFGIACTVEQTKRRKGSESSTTRTRIDDVSKIAPPHHTSLQMIEDSAASKLRSMARGSRSFVAHGQCFAYSQESGTCQKSSRESPREGVREI